MKEIIMDVLEDMSESQINLGSSAARETVAGIGIQTAALCVGGRPSYKDETESYDGTSWTEVNAINDARFGAGGAGTQGAGLVFGGETSGPPTVNTVNSEEWNGTSWTEGSNMTAARVYIAGLGTQTAALAATGNGDTDDAEEYNGTSWTDAANTNTGRYGAASGGAGIQTAGLIAGGGYSGEVESYDGSSWTELADVPDRNFAGMAGATNTEAISPPVSSNITATPFVSSKLVNLIYFTALLKKVPGALAAVVPNVITST